MPCVKCEDMDRRRKQSFVLMESSENEEENEHSSIDTSELKIAKYRQGEVFCDIDTNTVLHPITKEHIQTYFSHSHRILEAGLQIYQLRHLLALQSLQQSKHVQVLKGVCRMKKVQYEVYVTVLFTGQPLIATCQCSITNGTAAHCKHVAMVLYAAEQMYREKLILFHPDHDADAHIRNSKNTPIVEEQEKEPDKDRTCCNELDGLLFHPYPVHLIDKYSYTDRVLNLCIGLTNSTMPLKQLRGAANRDAIINDHSYAAKIVKTKDMTFAVETEDMTFAVETEDMTFAVETEDMTVGVNTEDMTVSVKTKDMSFAVETQDMTVGGNTEDMTVSVKTEDMAFAVETEDMTVGVNTEDMTVGVNTEDMTVGVNTEDMTVGVNTEDMTVSVKTEDMSFAVETEDMTVGVNTEDMTVSVKTEDMSFAVETEDMTVGVNTEDMTVSVKTEDFTVNEL